MKEGLGPSFIEINEVLNKGWEDPSSSTKHLNPDGSKKGWKKRNQDPNWLYKTIQDMANALLSIGSSEPGPNSGNITDRDERRKKFREDQ